MGLDEKNLALLRTPVLAKGDPSFTLAKKNINLRVLETPCSKFC